MCSISETKWDGKDIVVMDEVRIHPPYGVTDCSGKESSHSLNHVKKIVSFNIAHHLLLPFTNKTVWVVESLCQLFSRFSLWYNSIILNIHQFLIRNLLVTDLRERSINKRHRGPVTGLDI